MQIHAHSDSGPVLLPSYPDAQAVLPQIPALRDVAFTYDNALAGIALVACGHIREAAQIADALLVAPSGDPSYADGRLRNAYRAGPARNGHVLLAGFWNTHDKFWSQDGYQEGTATGNAAWASLFLLTMFSKTHDERYRDGAIAQLSWIDRTTLNTHGIAAYDGGFYGYDRRQQALGWKSTEQNIDVYAAARWAAHLSPAPRMKAIRDIAGNFVSSMWNAAEGRFFIGTLPDGRTISRLASGLDSQVWPLLAFDPPPPQWRRVWQWVEEHHRRDEAYGFNREPDGIWNEGCAQVATARQASGLDVPEATWTFLLSQRDQSGLIMATPQPRISTGLALAPDSVSADFYYYHIGHLGATAWSVLAALGWNPFDAQVMAQGRTAK